MPGRPNIPRRGRRGLIGMLLSIVVAVVIVIAIFAVYNQVTAAANAAQTAVFVRQVAPQITSEHRGNYPGLNNAAAVSSGLVPDNWRNGDTIVAPSGARVTFSPGGGGSFLITFGDGVPTETCKAVLGAIKSDHTLWEVRSGGTTRLADAIKDPSGINGACAGSADADFVLRFR